jgi:DUF4097 and DUF4098 domain-containing protein YvlB
MKKLFISLLMVALCGYAVAQSSSETPYLTKSFSGGSIRDAEVETSGGGIQVTGVDPSQARVEVFVSANGMHSLSAGEIKERLEKYYTVVISLDGGKLYVSAKTKGELSNFWNSGRALNISFHVFVPQAVSTRLSTSGGGIHLKNLSGTENFETSGGGLHIEDVNGKIHGRTSGGGIEVSNARNDIDLATSGGGIRADHCTGNIILSTSGGSLDLTDLSGNVQAETSRGGKHGDRISGDLSAQTSGGGIRLSGLSCTLDASTSGGSVDVSMTAIGKSIRLNTSAGNIALRLPSGKGLDLTLDADKIETSNLGAFNGVTEREHMKGSVNGGGIPVRLEASSGRISVACQ